MPKKLKARYIITREPPDTFDLLWASYKDYGYPTIGEALESFYFYPEVVGEYIIATCYDEVIE